jgi:hypothetical protein
MVSDVLRHLDLQVALSFCQVVGSEKPLQLLQPIHGIVLHHLRWHLPPLADLWKLALLLE